MSKIFFGLAAAIPGESAAVAVNAYQPDNLGAWVLVDTALLSALPANPDDAAEYMWDTVLINSAQAVLIAPVSAASEIRLNGIVPAPAKVDASLTTIYVSTVDLTGTVEAGVTLTARLIGDKIVLGGALVGRGAQSFTTDDSGYLSFTVARGAKVQIDFPPTGSFPIDTTGKDSINLADEVMA